MICCCLLQPIRYGSLLLHPHLLLLATNYSVYPDTAACLQTAVAAGMADLLLPIAVHQLLQPPSTAGSPLFGLQAASLTLLLPAFRLQ
jgi:hypothetical protein